MEFSNPGGKAKWGLVFLGVTAEKTFCHQKSIVLFTILFPF